jgi:myosin heavy subunit
MKVMNFSDDEIDFTFSIIAAILHLGNIVIDANTKGLATITEEKELKFAAKCLGVKSNELDKCLCRPIFVSPSGEKIDTHETKEKAVFNRDSLSKSIYKRLFDWLISKINTSLSTSEKTKNFIGVLDIAGFEIFDDINSFEQLCINFTNEKLQQFFNTHMFNKEQEEYKKERINWEYIDFGLDLQPTIDLIENSNGIFALLDEQNAKSQTNDKTLVRIFERVHIENPKFKLDKFNSMVFKVSHYAGEVPYNVDLWLSKNIDPLNSDSKRVMYSSSFSILKQFYEVDMRDVNVFQKGKKTGSRFQTVAQEYKIQLESLMRVLKSTEPHFIRCIKPNGLKKPGVLDNNMVLHQLRCNGVLEGIRISRKGYPGRIMFKYFNQRYFCLVEKEEFEKCKTPLEKSDLIMKKSGFIETKQYKIGQTKVFFKAGVEALLEKLREKKLMNVIINIQSACRGYIEKSRYEKLEEKIRNCEIIQNNFRAYYELKNWDWWKLVTKMRPLIDYGAIEREKKKVEELKLKYGEDLKVEEEKTRISQEQYDYLIKEIDEIKENIKKSIELQNELGLEVERLKTIDLVNQETALKFIEDERDKELKEQADLREQIKNLKEDFNKKVDEAERLFKEIGDKSSGSKEQIEKLKDAQFDVKELEDICKEEEENLIKVQEKVSSKTDERVNLENLKVYLEKAINESKQSLDEKTNLYGLETKELKHLEKVLDDLDGDLTFEKLQNQDMRIKFDFLENDILIKNDELKESEQKGVEISIQNKIYISKKEDLEEEYEENIKYLKYYEEELEKYQKLKELGTEELKLLTEKSVKLNEEYNDNRYELINNRNIISDKEQILYSLNSKVDELSNKIRILNENNEDMKSTKEKDIKRYNERWSEHEEILKEQISHIKEDTEGYNNQILRLDKEIERNFLDVSNIKILKDELDLKLNKLETQLQFERENKYSDIEKFREYDRIGRKLEKELQIKTSLDSNQDFEIEKLTGEIEEFIKEKKRYDDKLVDLLFEKNTIENERNNLLLEYQKLDKENEKSNIEIKKLKPLTTEQKQEQFIMNRNLDELLIENNEIKRKIEKYQEIAKEYETTNPEELNKEIMDLKTKIELLYDKIEKLNKLLLEQTQQIIIGTRENAEYEKKILKYKNKMQHSNQEIKELEEKIRKISTNENNLSVDYDNILENIKKEVNEKALLEQKIINLNPKIKEFKEIIDNYKREITRDDEIGDEMVLNCKKLEFENQAMEERNSSIKSNVEKLKITFELQEEANSKKIEELNNELELKMKNNVK